jgi:hypothetical protein
VEWPGRSDEALDPSIGVTLTLDPALSWVLRIGLALLFAAAAGHKLRDLEAFRAALGDYRLLPARATSLAAFALIALELASAVLLLVSPRGALVAAALLALYTVAIGANLARGRREIDCGCFGPAARQPLSYGLVARNTGLIALALVAALPVAPRALVWLDFTTIAAGVALFALVHAASNTLLAHAPRLRALRSS